MIRYTYINNQVLQLYKKMDTIKFPLNPIDVIKAIPDCRYMSYQRMAMLNDCSIDDVVQLCESLSGCTHYDVASHRYLILCNQSAVDNSPGRQRWTCGHEIGHIVCNHHVLSAYDKLAENSLLNVSDPQFEAEADYFAGSLLAPFPLFDCFSIKSPSDIQSVFGLSIEASQYRYKKYLRWKSTRVKTAWENDMIRIFKQKNISS